MLSALAEAKEEVERAIAIRIETSSSDPLLPLSLPPFGPGFRSLVLCCSRCEVTGFVYYSKMALVLILDREKRALEAKCNVLKKRWWW